MAFSRAVLDLIKGSALNVLYSEEFFMKVIESRQGIYQQVKRLPEHPEFIPLKSRAEFDQWFNNPQKIMDHPENHLEEKNIQRISDPREEKKSADIKLDVFMYDLMRVALIDYNQEKYTKILADAMNKRMAIHDKYGDHPNFSEMTDEEKDTIRFIEYSSQPVLDEENPYMLATFKEIEKYNIISEFGLNPSQGRCLHHLPIEKLREIQTALLSPNADRKTILDAAITEASMSIAQVKFRADKAYFDPDNPSPDGKGEKIKVVFDKWLAHFDEQIKNISDDHIKESLRAQKSRLEELIKRKIFLDIDEIRSEAEVVLNFLKLIQDSDETEKVKFILNEGRHLINVLLNSVSDLVCEEKSISSQWTEDVRLRAEPFMESLQRSGDEKYEENKQEYEARLKHDASWFTWEKKDKGSVSTEYAGHKMRLAGAKTIQKMSEYASQTTEQITGQRFSESTLLQLIGTLGQDRFFQLIKDNINPAWHTWEHVPGKDDNEKRKNISDFLNMQTLNHQLNVMIVLCLAASPPPPGFIHDAAALYQKLITTPEQKKQLEKDLYHHLKLIIVSCITTSTPFIHNTAALYQKLITTPSQIKQLEEELCLLLKVRDVSEIMKMLAEYPPLEGRDVPEIMKIIADYPLSPEEKAAPAQPNPNIALAQIAIQDRLHKVATDLKRVQKEAMDLLQLNPTFKSTLQDAMLDLNSISDGLRKGNDPKRFLEKLAGIEKLLGDYLSYSDAFSSAQGSIARPIQEPQFAYGRSPQSGMEMKDEKEVSIPPQTPAEMITKGIEDCSVFKMGKKTTFSPQGKADVFTIKRPHPLRQIMEGGRPRIIKSTRDFLADELTHEKLSDMKADSSEISAAYGRIAADPKSDGLSGTSKELDQLESGILLLTRLVTAKNELGTHAPERMNQVIEKTEVCLRENIATANPAAQSILNASLLLATEPKTNPSHICIPELDYFEKTMRFSGNHEAIKQPSEVKEVPRDCRADNPLVAIHDNFVARLNKVKEQVAIEEKTDFRENFSRDKDASVVLTDRVTHYRPLSKIPPAEKASEQKIGADTPVVTYTMGGDSGFCSLQHRTENLIKSDFFGEFKTTDDTHIMERAAREVETFRASLPPDIRNNDDPRYGMVITCGSALPDSLASAMKAYCDFNGYPFRAIRNLTEDSSRRWGEYLKTNQMDVEKQLRMLIGPKNERIERLNKTGDMLNDLGKMAVLYSEVRTLDAAPSITHTP